jgi:hypothetical protein
MRPTYLIHFGLGGHGLDFGGGNSLSGYEAPDTFEQRVAAGDYKEYDLEGVPAIDNRHVLRRRPGLAFTMPMHDGRLPVGAVEKLDRSDRSQSFLKTIGGMNQGNTWGALSQLAQNPEFSGLDTVAVDVYLQLWQREGALIGKFAGGRFLWQYPPICCLYCHAVRHGEVDRIICCEIPVQVELFGEMGSVDGAI